MFTWSTSILGLWLYKLLFLTTNLWKFVCKKWFASLKENALTRKPDNLFPKIIKWTPIIRWLTMHSHYCLASSIALLCNLGSMKLFLLLFYICKPLGSVTPRCCETTVFFILIFNSRIHSLDLWNLGSVTPTWIVWLY